MPWRAEDIRRRLDLLLRHNARGAAASDDGTISLETAAELLKTSVGTIEYVVEHARYRVSGEMRFELQGDGVRATNGPAAGWWGTAHIVASRKGTADSPTDIAAADGASETSHDRMGTADSPTHMAAAPDIGSDIDTEVHNAGCSAATAEQEDEEFEWPSDWCSSPDVCPQEQGKVSASENKTEQEDEVVLVVSSPEIMKEEVTEDEDSSRWRFGNKS
jgi:hypothetical protein